MKKETPLEKAINIAGNQVILAEQLGVTPQAVQQWKKNNKVPAERVISVERLTGVSRHDIRPDIYPPETTCAS